MPKKRPLMTAADVNGIWAIVPTPAKPGAERWDAEDTVDVDETARVVDGLIGAGVDAILSMGTLGECATLTWPEKQKFMSTLVETARGRIPVFVGTTTLSTRDTVRETRFAADLGADGTMLGFPMWCALSLPGAVQFYRDVAEACPDMAIAIYANTEAFRFEFPPPFWAQVAEIPQVVTCKYVGVSNLLLNYQVTRRRIRFLPIDFDYYGAARMDPEHTTAFWTSGAVCGPSVVVGLRDEVERAKKTGDWSKAKALSEEMAKTAAPLFPPGGFKEFSMYNIPLEKARMDAAGWMKAGPCRPPYHVAPAPYVENAKQSGRLWAELAKRIDGR
jgi:trans-o-hydroxybenzylidenepyruvate hydratase-aldolase